MLRSIVCGVDDSAEARRALLVGAALARRLEAELRVVHVLEVRSTVSMSPEEDLELLAPGADLLRRVQAEGGIEGDRSMVESGAPADRLRELAAEAEAELIVVGSRGRGQLATAVLGSVAAALGAEAPCPVVVVSADAAIPEFEHKGRDAPPLICGVDGSAEASAATRVASRLGERLGLRSILVHALEPRDLDREATGEGPRLLQLDYETRLDRHTRPALRLLDRALEAADRPASAEVYIGIGDPAEVIEAVAAAEHAQLIAVGSRGQGRVRAAFLGSVSAGLASSSKWPVLIVSPDASAKPT